MKNFFHYPISKEIIEDNSFFEAIVHYSLEMGIKIIFIIASLLLVAGAMWFFKFIGECLYLRFKGK